MQTTIVLTVIGPDQPGIVEQVASRIEAVGGNWLQSQLAHLAGRFAGIVEAELPHDGLTALRAQLDELEAQTGLRCVIGEEAATSVPNAHCTELEIVGQDRPGIVRAVTDALRAAGGNVASFESQCVDAPMSGESLFRAQIRVCFEEDADLDLLEERLAEVGNELMLDVEWAAD